MAQNSNIEWTDGLQTANMIMMQLSREGDDIVFRSEALKECVESAKEEVEGTREDDQPAYFTINVNKASAALGNERRSRLN